MDVSIYRHSARVLSVFLCLIFLAAGRAGAARVPSGFADMEVASGLTSPTSMAVLPDGRVLVVQQNGVIRMIKNDAMLGTNFHTVPNVDSFVERGCLGIVADPDFARNHYIYIYCTVKDGAASRNRIMRVAEANDVAAPGSQAVIFDLPQVPAGVQWHMGGALRFGPDGKLYVAVGNHEDFWVPSEQSNSQNLANPFGKILRIDANGAIPRDNPYFTMPGAFTANFNLGLRNPFAFDIQPGTGLMYINDVGAALWEEINKGEARANYGWPASEGGEGDSSNSGFTYAVHAYPHSMGCAITGGAFYNPPTAQFPASYVGKYLFADFCGGWIRILDPANPGTPGEFATGIGNPVNLGIAPDGSLYYLARNQEAGIGPAAVGMVGKISFTNSQAPRITANPTSQTIVLGDPVAFTVAADAGTGFQWQRNGVDIPGANSASYTIASTRSSDNQAAFRAVVRNAFGTAVSSTATLTVTTNRKPKATIANPVEESGFAPGDRLTYSGTGTDPEDGVLPASAFTWQVDYMHDTHSHPFLAAPPGAASGSFTVSDFEADAVNTWFRIYLTVKDSQGLTDLAVRDIYPRSQVSDMTPVGVPLNGRGPIEISKSNGDSAAGDGGTITLSRIPYAKGLGVHAPSDIRYSLGGGCAGSFVADIGVDDAVGAQGSVVFQIFLDGVKAFDSGIMRGSELRRAVNVSVAGKRGLRLVVTDGGDGNMADHADWAGARVTGCPAAPS